MKKAFDLFFGKILCKKKNDVLYSQTETQTKCDKNTLRCYILFYLTYNFFTR